VRKLIIQIPCYNEQENLPAVLAALPRSLPGIATIETLVIDDGSWDRTAEVACTSGANYLVRFPTHLGLAQAFSAGLDAALKLGADIIVNTDADHQYKGSEVAKLVQPIVDGTAEMVVGDRQPYRNPDFGPSKQLLQWIGSWVVRQLSGTDVPDATSGFRAFSRRAALKLNVFTKFTYTLETIIQAGKKHLAVRHVPIETNAPTRPSRLFHRIPTYLKHSIATLVRIYVLYEPLKVFFRLGGASLFVGILIGLRFLFEYLKDGGAGHLQSLLLAVVLVIIGVQTLLIGLVADLIGSSRALLEDTLFRVREIELRMTDASECVRLDPTADAPRTLVEVRRGPR
jgi:glycosyltransferase involved in cell wall biosynthesis